MQTTTLLALLFAFVSIANAAATRIWNGSSSTGWRDAYNWEYGPVPSLVVAGDTLSFPASGLNKSNFNNFASGTVFGRLQLTHGYARNGNPVALTNGVFLGIPLIGTANLNDGADPTVGTFTGLPQGVVFLLGGQTYSISYTGGTGNDVALTRVIGPASLSSPERLANGQFPFQGLGEAGLSYLVQANTNLGTTNWLNVGTAPANGAGLFQFLDTNAPLHPRRFYRAVSP